MSFDEIYFTIYGRFKFGIYGCDLLEFRDMACWNLGIWFVEIYGYMLNSNSLSTPNM